MRLYAAVTTANASMWCNREAAMLRTSICLEIYGAHFEQLL